MVKTKSFLQKFYVGLIFTILYAPIAVLIVCSFNASKARTIWGGFTLDWYVQLFQNEAVIDAVKTSLMLTTSAALIATLLGTFACIGQLGITKAYVCAPAKEISVYDYTQVVFAAILGFFVFGDVPDYLSIIGYVLICGAGIVMFIYNNGKFKKAK